METQTTMNLFSPIHQDGLELKNRIVMAPMTRSRAIGTQPNELMAKYYSQRSSAGLIIAEGTSPSRNGLGYARIPGIYSEEQTEGWKNITQAVHKSGSKIFLQLMHTGRIAHPINMPEGAEILAPSPIRAEGKMWTDPLGMQEHPEPKAMSLMDIQQAIEEFAKGARNAIKAGFDGVEIHGANGYLLEQFLNPHSNQRTDHYGGSVQNRLRFISEVTQAIVQAIGKEKVGIRLSPYGNFNDMPAYQATSETYMALTRELNRLDVLYIHVIDSSAKRTEEGKKLLKAMRENFGRLFIVNGGYSHKLADNTVQSGDADLVSFGIPFIANPDFPQRIKNNISLSPADPNLFYSADEKGYTDYPFYDKTLHDN
jgi:N-ethylmaleimide reductase